MLLPYCIVEDAIQLPAEKGVRGAALRIVEYAGLRCVVSDYKKAPEDFGREDALAYHNVVKGVFAQASVIPFRFPTLLADEAELLVFLDVHSFDYRETIEALRDYVQMEVVIAPAAAAATADGGKKKSGKEGEAGREYLRDRAADVAALAGAAGQIQKATGDAVREWRVREGARGIRLFALVTREGVGQFRERMAQLGALPVKAMVSGPWPATEFMAALHSEG